MTLYGCCPPKMGTARSSIVVEIGRNIQQVVAIDHQSTGVLIHDNQDLKGNIDDVKHLAIQRKKLLKLN